MSVIQSLDISNFQKLSRAVIEPSGNVIMLCGKNANGKTSVLDAITVGWCGHNGREIKRPIKDGHGKATIDITMTDGTVLTRKYTPSGTTLTAKGPDGTKLGQKDLDRMISSLGVDASAFARAGEKDQLKTLLSVVDLPFVPADLDAERNDVFTRRRDTNRDVAQLDAQYKAFMPMPDDLPDEEVSVSALLTQHHTAVQQNTAVEQAHNSVTYWQNEVETLRAQLAESEESLAKAVSHASDAPAIIDADAIQAQIDTAEITNSQVRVSKEKRAVASRLAAATGAAEALTAQLVEIDQRKADGLANAEMPVDGLSFDEEGVLYQGLPFSRASAGEQIIVSAAMIIATDPAVRTMVIRNGSLLDEDSLAVLQEMCEENNFQAFVEFASNSTDHEFRLVDGELAA